MNLCLMLILITLLALRQSADVFGPDEFSYESAIDNSLFKQYRNVGPLGSQLRAAIGYPSEWTQRSRIINEWFLEYKNASWESYRATDGAESDLVEARLHIANAEVFGVVTGEKQRAQKELIRADSYLQHSLAAVGSDLRPFVNAVCAKIAETKLDLEMDRLETEINHDEQIKTDLDSLIQLLHGKSLQPVSKS